jgi:hypothetical protein
MSPLGPVLGAYSPECVEGAFSEVPLCSILHRGTRAQPITLLGTVLRTGSDYNILDWRIKMRWRGYIALSSPRCIGTCREMIRSPLQQFYSSFTVEAANLG